MPETKDLKELASAINELLSQTKIDDITSESNSFQELPEGYYLCSVDSAEIKESKTSHMPMIAFAFSVTENGSAYIADAEGNAEMKELKGTKNRKIFMYYVLKDTASVRRFVSDMLKFENDKGQPLLDKEYFMNSEILGDALKLLEGMNIYVQITKSELQDGTSRSWQNLISWKRANALGLPM